MLQKIPNRPFDCSGGSSVKNNYIFLSGKVTMYCLKNDVSSSQNRRPSTVIGSPCFWVGLNHRSVGQHCLVFCRLASVILVCFAVEKCLPVFDFHSCSTTVLYWVQNIWKLPFAQSLAAILVVKCEDFFFWQFVRKFINKEVSIGGTDCYDC